MDYYKKIKQAIEWGLEDTPPILKNNLKTKKGDDAWIIPSNYESLISDHIEYGLLEWGRGVDPRPHFKRAFVVYGEFIDYLKTNNLDAPQMNCTAFYYAAYLMDETVIWAPLHENVFASYQVMSRFLLDRTMEVESAEDVKEFAHEYLDYERPSIVRQSFVNYLALLDAQGTQAIEECVDICEKNYLKRAKSKSVAYDAYDGFGLPSDLFVDFWLAAILKKKSWQGESRHKWIWG